MFIFLKIKTNICFKTSTMEFTRSFYETKYWQTDQKKEKSPPVKHLNLFIHNVFAGAIIMIKLNTLTGYLKAENTVNKTRWIKHGG